MTDSLVQDGLSIFYYARATTARRDSSTVTTIVYGKKGRTVFRPGSTPAFEEIDAVENGRVRVVPIEGKAEFRGMFGFTGEFRGWFSDDRTGIPIKAELKVLIGSIKIELIQWKRSGWSPPVVPKE